MIPALLLAVLLGLTASRSDDSARIAARPTTTTPRRIAKRQRPHQVDRDALAVERVRKRTPYVVSGGGERREVALTFDDGPGPYTPRVLAQLRRLHVPATFFEVGFMVPDFHQVLRRELRMGAAIGDHTEGHVMLERLSPRAQRKQILVQAQQLHRYGASLPQLFRPPYGSWNQATLRLLRRYRMLMVLWSIDSEDYRQPGVRAIVRGVLSRAKSGSIVLLHDAGGTRTQTIAALPAIVRGLRRRHYRLVTVPRLMRDDPPRRLPHLRHDLSGS